MGFERAESPSRVKGSALVGLGKARNSASRDFGGGRKSACKYLKNKHQKRGISMYLCVS